MKRAGAVTTIRGEDLLRFVVLSGLLLCVLPGPLLSAEEVETTEPELLSLFPLVGQRGTTLDAQIRGRELGGSYAVWLQADGLTAQLEKVEVVEEGATQDEEADPSGEKTEENLPVYRVLVRIAIDATAPVGPYFIRIVSPQGLSNAVPFRVVDESVVMEAEEPHQTVKQAQPVSFPAIVNGRLTNPGEVDYYSLNAFEGQEISLEIVLAQSFEPRLALYRPTGSWLDPNRPTRILSNEDGSSDLIPVKTRVTYRPLQEGRYAVEVSSLFGKGSPDCSYQLRIAPSKESFGSGHEAPGRQRTWRARTFSRRLESDWITTLHSRTVIADEGPSAGDAVDTSTQRAGESSDVPADAVELTEVARIPASVSEREPNSSVNNALKISIPAIVEGSIDRPGDIDSFRFRVNPGQKLAFEIEAPESKPPHFHPRMGVIDAEDRELFTNLHKRISLINNNAERLVYFQSVEPKVVYTFTAEGEYFLQVRDITSRYGSASYTYRVLVRSQIPHVGEVLIGEFDPLNLQVSELDRINLVRGQAKKLTIFTSHEEEFTGDVSFAVTGLPQGVQAFPAAEVNNTTKPTDVTVAPERVLAKTQETTVVLLAEADTPPTRMPVTIRLHCRPIVKGKPGSNLLVREIPLMVVKARQPKG